jgi:hypothetical protein
VPHQCRERRLADDLEQDRAGGDDVAAGGCLQTRGDRRIDRGRVLHLAQYKTPGSRPAEGLVR